MTETICPNESCLCFESHYFFGFCFSLGNSVKSWATYRLKYWPRIRYSEYPDAASKNPYAPSDKYTLHSY